MEKNGTCPSWDELAMERVLWSPEDLDKRVAELANAISEDFSGQSIAVVGVATGAFMFLADLVRKIKIPVTVDLIRVQSYGAKTQSSGVVNLLTDIRIDVKDKHVLLVEDIIDTGITLSALVAHFAAKDVASLSICTLMDKLARRVVPLQLPAGGRYYRGFECPDEFVVGYGMDYAEQYRSLPYTKQIMSLEFEGTEATGKVAASHLLGCLNLRNPDQHSSHDLPRESKDVSPNAYYDIHRKFEKTALD